MTDLMRLPLISVLVVIGLQADVVAQSPRLRLELQCRDSERLFATIHNAGNVDTAVIFGAVLNKAKYMVSDLTLSALKDGGEPEQFRYNPSHYPVRISGQLLDWVVPLPVGASYALMLQSSDFVPAGKGWRKGPSGPERQALSAFPSATRLSVRLAVRPPSSQNPEIAQRQSHVWTEKEALVSNEVQVPGDCR